MPHNIPHSNPISFLQDEWITLLSLPHRLIPRQVNSLHALNRALAEATGAEKVLVLSGKQGWITSQEHTEELGVKELSKWVLADNNVRQDVIHTLFGSSTNGKRALVSSYWQAATATEPVEWWVWTPAPLDEEIKRVIGALVDYWEVLIPKADNAIERALSQMDTLVADGMLYTNTLGQIHHVNAHVAQIIGMGADLLKGKNLYELVHEEDLPILESLWKQTLSQPNTFVRREIRLLRNKREPFWCLLQGKYLVTAGNDGFLFQVRDINTEKENHDRLVYSFRELKVFEELDFLSLQRSTPLSFFEGVLASFSSFINLVDHQVIICNNFEDASCQVLQEGGALDQKRIKKPTRKFLQQLIQKKEVVFYSDPEDLKKLSGVVQTDSTDSQEKIILPITVGEYEQYFLILHTNQVLDGMQRHAFNRFFQHILMIVRKLTYEYESHIREAHLKSLVETTGFGMIMLDEQLRVTHWSQEVDQLIGSCTLTKDQTFWEIECLQPYVNELRHTYDLAVDKEDIQSVTLPVRTDDSSKRWLQWSIAVHQIPEERRMVISVQDVTPAYQIEEQKNLLRQVTSYFPRGSLTLIDTDGIIRITGGANYQLHGLDAADFENKHYKVALPQIVESEEYKGDPIEDALQGESVTYEMSFGDLQYRTIASPIHIGDELRFILLAVTDVTKEKQQLNRSWKVSSVLNDWPIYLLMVFSYIRMVFAWI